jgi:hypothetical protein
MLDSVCLWLDARGSFRSTPIASVPDLAATVDGLAEVTTHLVKLTIGASQAAYIAAEGQTETINDARLAGHLVDAGEAIAHALVPARHCRQALLAAADQFTAAASRLKRLHRQEHQPSTTPSPWRTVEAPQAVANEFAALTRLAGNPQPLHTAGALNARTVGLANLSRRIGRVATVAVISTGHHIDELYQTTADSYLAEQLTDAADATATAARAIEHSHRLLCQATEPTGAACERLWRLNSTPLRPLFAH